MERYYSSPHPNGVFDQLQPVIVIFHGDSQVQLGQCTVNFLLGSARKQ
jgi:hypothetical protein